MSANDSFSVISTQLTSHITRSQSQRHSLTTQVPYLNLANQSPWPRRKRSLKNLQQWLPAQSSPNRQSGTAADHSAQVEHLQGHQLFTDWFGEPYDLSQFDLSTELDTSFNDDDNVIMQTLNAIANEDYQNATSHDAWHCVPEASTAPISFLHESTATQDLVQQCSDRSLTTSHDHSPILGAGDMFSSLDTAPTSQNPPYTNPNGSPGSGYDSSIAKRSGGSPSSSGRSPDEKGQKVQKRQRNTEAARRYRQRKVDKVSELEEALQSMTKERDDLRLRLARSEAEADVLRGLVGKQGR